MIAFEFALIFFEHSPDSFVYTLYRDSEGTFWKERAKSPDMGASDFIGRNRIPSQFNRTG